MDKRSKKALRSPEVAEASAPRPTIDKARLKRVSEALAAVTENHGKEAINDLKGAIVEAPCLSTDLQALDDILTGVVEGAETVVGSGKGLPKGRLVEVFGPESCGKTTLLLMIAKAVQRQGGVVAYIDVEHALDLVYARRLGVSTEQPQFLFSQPNSAEEALSIVSTMARSGIDLVIIDSVAALTPKDEMDEDGAVKSVGLQARMMSQHCRKVSVLANKSGTTIVYINQIRMKIGVMFGNPETTPGGNALRFYSSLRLSIRPSGEKIKKGSTPIGIRSKIYTVKNKVAPPFRTVFVDIKNGLGITHASLSQEAIKVKKTRGK